ncbi:MAG TPA: hypothetical protein VK116_09890, partial [Planctomycetota bacterium]|nr:hypothetical protein [Planctomycetota bacterium]
SQLWIVLALGALVVGWLVVPRLFPTETRIRWALEDAIESFNAARAGGVVAPLANDWYDRSTRATKDAVRGYLAALFLRKENRHGGRFRYQAEAIEESWRIQASGESADVSVRVQFRDAREAEGSEPLWTIDVTASLEERDREWLITRSGFEKVSGERPF